MKQVTINFQFIIISKIFYKNIIQSWLNLLCMVYYALHGAVVVMNVWKMEFYNYLCNRCLSWLKLWVRIPLMARSTWYNIMW